MVSRVLRSLARVHGWTAAIIVCACAQIPVMGEEPNDSKTQSTTDVDDEEAEESSVSPFSLHASDFELELNGDYQNRRVNSHSNLRRDTKQRDEDSRFEESVDLRLDGHLIDPRVIQWEAGLRLGLSQEHASEEFNGFSQHDRSSGDLIDYDVSVDFFPGGSLSGNAYARKSRDRLPRRFLPSLMEDRTEAGASAFWTQGKWNGQLSLDWSDLDRSGNRAERDDEQLETTRLSFDNRWEISDRQQLRIEYDHEQENSEYQGSTQDFDTTRDQFRVEHEQAFGDQGQHHLSSYFRYNNEEGDLARDELEAVTRLSLRHSDEWQTAYRYSAYRVDQDAVEITRHKGDFQAMYRPDDRWRVTFDSFAMRESVDDDIESHQFGGGLDVAYRQPTSKGELRGNFSFQADQLRTVGDAADGVVLGEVHVLDSVRPAFLLQPDIKFFSIRAYNASRTRIYLQGRDYLVIRIGRVTSLYRILSGRISEGEPVSVDYHYRIPAGSRADTYRTDLRLEHAYTNGLTPYYSFDLRREDITGSRAVSAFTDNTERHHFGGRIERAAWSGGAEVELTNDSVEPYNAFHTDVRVALLRQSTHEMDASIRYSYFDFDGDRARRVNWFEVDATNRLRLSPYLSGTLKTAYRWEDNSLDGLTEGVDVECGLEYLRGALHVELIVEYDSLDIDENSERGFGVWLNIRRDLSHLLASGKH